LEAVTLLLLFWACKGDRECLDDTTFIFFFDISFGLRVAGMLLIEGYRLWWVCCYYCKTVIGETAEEFLPCRVP